MSALLSNQTCHLCLQNPATAFCSCTQPFVLLCSSCEPSHVSKASYHHVLLPLDASAPPFAAGPLEEKKAALRRNIERLDKHCAEVSIFVDTTTAYISHYGEWMQGVLKGKREEVNTQIEVAIGEADVCAAQGILPSSPLARAVLTMPANQLEAIVACSINYPKMQEICESCFVYSNSLQSICDNYTYALHPAQNPPLPFPSQLLVSLKADTVEVFNYREKKWKSQVLQPAIFADKHSRYVWIDSHLFCSGGGSCPSWSGAYVLSQTEQWTARRVTDMLTARGRHGLWWQRAQAAVLVFGGNAYAGCGNTYSRQR